MIKYPSLFKDPKAQADRKGVMVGLMVSLRDGLSVPHFVAPNVKLNSSGYCAILADIFAPQLFSWGATPLTPTTLVQDNAPSHNSLFSRTFVEATGWKELGLTIEQQCPQSPDVNLLDTSIWSSLEAQVSGQSRAPGVPASAA